MRCEVDCVIVRPICKYFHLLLWLPSMSVVLSQHHTMACRASKAVSSNRMRNAVLVCLAWQAASQPLPTDKSRRMLVGAGVLALASEYEIRHNTARAIKTHQFHSHLRKTRQDARQNARAAQQATVSAASEAKQRLQRVDWKAWQRSREGRIAQGGAALVLIVLLAAHMSTGGPEDGQAQGIWATAARKADSAADKVWSGARRAASAASAKAHEIGAHLKPHTDRVGSQVSSAAEDVGARAQELGKVVRPKAEEFGSQLSSTAHGVSSAVQPKAEEWGHYVSSAAQSVGGAVVPQAQALGGQISAKAQAVGDAVGPQAEQLGSQIGEGAQQLTSQVLPARGQPARPATVHVAHAGISTPDSILLTGALARPTMLLLAAALCDSALQERSVLAHVAPEQRKRVQSRLQGHVGRVSSRAQQVQLPAPIVVTGANVRHAMEGLWQRVRGAMAWVPARARLLLVLARQRAPTCCVCKPDASDCPFGGCVPQACRWCACHLHIALDLQVCRHLMLPCPGLGFWETLCSHSRISCLLADLPNGPSSVSAADVRHSDAATPETPGTSRVDTGSSQDASARYVRSPDASLELKARGDAPAKSAHLPADNDPAQADSSASEPDTPAATEREGAPAATGPDDFPAATEPDDAPSAMDGADPADPSAAGDKSPATAPDGDATPAAAANEGEQAAEETDAASSAVASGAVPSEPTTPTSAEHQDEGAQQDDNGDMKDGALQQEADSGSSEADSVAAEKKAAQAAAAAASSDDDASVQAEQRQGVDSARVIAPDEGAADAS